MSKHLVLNTGKHIPWLAFGTGTALYDKDAASPVCQAIQHGITHLDGAQMYKNEDSLGAGIIASGKPRSELFITTKFHGRDLPPGRSIKDTLKDSLAKLGTDYVDLFLIHDPTPATKEGNSRLADWWEQMEQLHSEGLARSIGVSNFNVENLKIVLESGTVVPAVNQIEMHPYIWKAAKPIVDLCQERGIVIESYGGLTPIIRVQSGPLDPVLEKIRERLEKSYGQPVSTGQVLTKWLLSKEFVVVTTTSKVERIKQFQGVEIIPDLTPGEVQEIEAAGSKLHKRQFMAHAFQD